MKCKGQRPFTSTVVDIMKNGSLMAKGACHICGTTVCKILGKPKEEVDTATAAVAILMPTASIVPPPRASKAAVEEDEEEEMF